MTQPGWYGEPGNAAIERYWDGAQWTPQTRPVVPANEQCASSGCSRPRKAGRFVCEEHAAMADKAGPQAAAAAAAALAVIKTCAIPSCNAPRVDATFCAQHGPRGQTSPARAARGNAQLICPHCQVQGRVTTRRVKMKQGVSGGKATAAVLTAGISMLGTGLSRKEKVTEMRCGNCGTVWHV